jgi:class 3 adenylate cyclase
VGASWNIDLARTSDGIDVAYAVYGEGPRDVVLIHGFTTHLDFVGDSAWHANWLRRLGEHFRVIQFDKRGSGLSDRDLGHGSIEDRTRDVVAVMDAAGSEHAAIVGISEGGPHGLTFAATYPDRVDKLVLYGSFARILWAPDHPGGVSADLAQEFCDLVSGTWGSGESFATFFLTHASDPEAAVRLMAKFERNACTRQMAGEIMQRNIEIDVRALLPGISVPTLVMHNRDDPLIPFEVGRHIADNIVGAELVEGDGDYHCTWQVREFEPFMARALAFLNDDAAAPRRTPAAGPASRSIATILFTDIVGSTDRAAAMGDGAWGSLLDRHHRLAGEATRRGGGTLVKTTGDGVLALFDGPSRAIQAVHELTAGVADLDIELRAGIHTGEIERGGGDVSGIGVHIAARVMGLAGPGELLTSRTVKDLAAGSGIEFVERGTEVLRGVPGEWAIYAVPAPAG